VHGALLAAASLLAGAYLGQALGASAAPASRRTVDVKLQHGRVAGGRRVIRVTEGDEVTIRWTTDTAVTVHLHGYDVEESLPPDETVRMRFKAFATGRFPIAVHGSHPGPEGSRRAGAGESEEAVLLYVEVRPR